MTVPKHLDPYNTNPKPGSEEVIRTQLELDIQRAFGVIESKWFRNDPEKALEHTDAVVSGDDVSEAKISVHKRLKSYVDRQRFYFAL